MERKTGQKREKSGQKLQNPPFMSKYVHIFVGCVCGLLNNSIIWLHALQMFLCGLLMVKKWQKWDTKGLRRENI